MRLKDLSESVSPTEAVRLPVGRRIALAVLLCLALGAWIGFALVEGW